MLCSEFWKLKTTYINLPMKHPTNASLKRQSRPSAGRVTVSLGLILLLLCGQVLAGIHLEIAPNSRLAVSGEAVKAANARAEAYTGSAVVRYGGGVVPRGGAVFVLGEGPQSEKISPNALEIRVEIPKQLFNGSVDYDSFQIVHKNKAYNLDIDDEVFCRLVPFIARDAFLLFTVPPAAKGEALKALQADGLVRCPQTLLGKSVYMAKEFETTNYFDFFFWVDILSSTTKLPNDAATKILAGMKKNHIKAEGDPEWVNADFHVDYLVMLRTANDKLWVDVGGVPLRYYWRLEPDSTLKVVRVEAFEMPSNGNRDKDQYRAIALFQAAAILRQFKSDNPSGFAVLAKRVAELKP